MSRQRPEYQAPPEIFYNEDEARKYTTNSRIMEIQRAMSERAYELLDITDEQPRLLLDIGCGSGLSGEVLSDEGHIWVGVDISKAMLDIARETEAEGDMFLMDIGAGLPFRTGVFDGAISISALQWLCNADKATHNPHRRLTIFFQSLYNCLTRGARAVFQFYPDGPDQMELITTCAMKCGFTGGLVVDYPHSTRAKKYFLCLFAGQTNQEVPRGLGTAGSAEPETHVPFTAERRRAERRKRKGREPVKSRSWILAKKERQRKQGKEVRPDTKYTGRKRPAPF